MTHLNDGDRRRRRSAGHPADRSEDMEPPRGPPQVELMLGEPGHRIQTLMPTRHGAVRDDLVGTGVPVHPHRICERATVLDTQLQFGTAPRPRHNLRNRAIVTRDIALLSSNTLDAILNAYARNGFEYRAVEVRAHHTVL